MQVGATAAIRQNYANQQYQAQVQALRQRQAIQRRNQQLQLARQQQQNYWSRLGVSIALIWSITLKFKQ